MDYIETSAKTGENVHNAFLSFAKELKKQVELDKKNKKATGQELGQMKTMKKLKPIPAQKKKGCSCWRLRLMFEPCVPALTMLNLT